MKKNTSFQLVTCSMVILVLSALLFAFSSDSAHKKTVDGEVHPTVSAVDDIVLDEMAKRYYVGCAVAVVKNGRIIHQSGYGHMDELRKSPVTVNTVFHWASISKVVTAAAAWRLIENNKLGLNDRVHNLVGYWPSNGNKDLITVSQLMSHRSGINHYTNYTESNYTSLPVFNARQSVSVFSTAPLDFTPGTQNQYTTFGYNLLGAVVEEKSNRGYVEYVKNNIKEPLGLTSLTENSFGVKGYEMTCNGGLESQEEGSTMWKLPGGGWASNIVDLAKFMMGLMDNKILANTSQMWQPIPDNDSYCYGIKNDAAGSEIRISHGGANQGVSTEMAFYPNSGFGVVVYINGDAYADARNLAKRIEKYYSKSVSASQNGYKTVNCGTDERCKLSDGEDKLAGVWRPDAGETVWRRRLGFDQFHAEWDWLNKVAGYELIDMQTYSINEVRYWDGIFKKQDLGTALWRNFSQDGFHDKWLEMVNEGYRLIDLETYLDGNDRLWAGVFEKGTGSSALYRNLTGSDFIDKHHDEQTQGKSLIDIEVFKNADGVFLWSGVWRQGPPTHFWKDMTLDEFNLKINEEAHRDYRLKDVETYLVGNVRKWAGVFDPFNKNCAFSQGKTYCQLATDDASFMGQVSPQTLIDIEIFK